MDSEARYSITTWDTDTQSFTPQIGLTVPSQGIPWQGIKPVFRQLQNMGYTCHRTHRCSDPSVLIERIN